MEGRFYRRESKSDKERIELRCIPEPNSGCWLWEGATWKLLGSAERPNVGVRGKKVFASRASYEAFVGPIPDGMLILHRCDNPMCVNPDHLFPGTHADNMADMVSKGRQGKRYPGPRKRLSLRQRGELMQAIPVETVRAVMDRFGISRTTVTYYQHKLERSTKAAS